MTVETPIWESPIILDDDFESHRDSIEENIVQPAISAIKNEAINNLIMEWIPDSPESISNDPWNPEWDSSMRFREGVLREWKSWQRVLPYSEERSPSGYAVNKNEAFDESGLIVFARSNPANAYQVDVRREKSDRIYISLKITIPSFAAFDFGWFRIQ